MIRPLVRTVSVLGTVAVVTLTFVPSASAATVNPSQCLNGAPSGDFVDSSYSPVELNNITLFCGGRNTGVKHINIRHKIAKNGSDDANVIKCHDNIASMGYTVPASGGRNRGLQISRGNGWTATLVYRNPNDQDRFKTVTMFTSDNNNWGACARFPN